MTFDECENIDQLVTEFCTHLLKKESAGYALGTFTGLLKTLLKDGEPNRIINYIQDKMREAKVEDIIDDNVETPLGEQIDGGY